MRVAVVEISSRAVRLLVADVSADSIDVIETDAGVTHLQSAILDEQGADTATLDLVRNLVSQFVARAKAARAERTLVFGTEAIRRIKRHDGSDGVASLGSDILVLNKKTEAICSFVSALRGLPDIAKHAKRAMVVDQGAGSMEVAVGRLTSTGAELEGFRSYQLGTHTMLNEWRRLNEDFRALDAAISARIADYVFEMTAPPSGVIVMGSAATKAAWVKVRGGEDRYSPLMVHGQAIKTSALTLLVDWASRNADEVRRFIDARNPKNVNTDICGWIALRHWMQRTGRPGFYVSAWRTSHGVAWMLANSPSFPE